MIDRHYLAHAALAAVYGATAAILVLEGTLAHAACALAAALIYAVLSRHPSDHGGSKRRVPHDRNRAHSVGHGIYRHSRKERR